MIILQNSYQRSAHGHRGAVQGVDEPGPLLTGDLITDIEPPRLVIRAIRRAGDFPVFAGLAAAGHPSFQIVLAISRPAEVAGTGVNDVIGNAEPLKDFLFNAEELFVDRLTLVGRAEGEHFHLGKLMHAVQPARVAPRSAGLGAETVRQADVLDG